MPNANNNMLSLVSISEILSASGGKLKEFCEACLLCFIFPPSPCELVLNKVKEDKITHYSLAQICLPGPEFHKLRFLDITATTACCRGVTPGRAINPVFSPAYHRRGMSEAN